MKPICWNIRLRLGRHVKIVPIFTTALTFAAILNDAITHGLIEEGEINNVASIGLWNDPNDLGLPTRLNPSPPPTPISRRSATSLTPSSATLAHADDEWDLIDIDRRAEEHAVVDAHERGLIFA